MSAADNVTSPDPARLDPPVSSARIVYDFAGTTVGFKADDPVWEEWLDGRFAPFRADRAPSWVIELSLGAPTPDFLESPLEVHNEAIAVTPSGGGFRLESETFSARVSPAERAVELEGPMATYPVDAVLRHLLPLFVDDGLVVHAAMLSVGDMAWILSGPPECGKTTLTELLPDLAACDELAAVRRVRGEWWAMALPFWRARPARGRLRSLFLLAHGEEHRRVGIGAGRAARALASQVLWPTARAQAMGRAFNVLADLSAAVPVWRLEFALRPDVVELILDEDLA